MSKRNYVITRSEACEAKQGPVTFLFGWAGSKDAHLAKYSKFYEDHNMTTVRYITPIFLAGVPGPELSQPLLPAFEEVNAADRELIFHLFSMNGCMMVTSLWQILDQQRNGRQIKEKIKGIVFD
uniref:Transmembrane protein 53 n=1 Tax=Plectus sambesii TaxID=2011161 RepID=A0A914WFR2_9BILA